MAAAIDDSCRRPGSVPFKWEVCPGTPKHVRTSSASASSSFHAATPTPSNSSRVAPVSPKLAPPPCMSPSPYHSPRVASSYAYSSAARSASVSPSRRRRRPTAFIDVAPRASAGAVTYSRGAGAAGRPKDYDHEEEAAAAAYKCFPLPVFRRKGSGVGRRSATMSSGSSFQSDGATPAVPGGALRRSASSSSSSCLSLSSGNNSSRKFAESREVEAATGSWYF